MRVVSTVTTDFDSLMRAQAVSIIIIVREGLVRNAHAPLLGREDEFVLGSPQQNEADDFTRLLVRDRK